MEKNNLEEKRKGGKKEADLTNILVLAILGVIIMLTLISYLSLGVEAADPLGPDDVLNVDRAWAMYVFNGTDWSRSNP